MRKLARLAGAALLVALGIQVLDWLVSPVIPLLITMLVLTVIWSVAVGGRAR